MGKSIEVLILEDCPSDAELMLAELRRAGFQPVCRRAVTQEEYRAHLGPAIDVILADYHLPQFDALRAMAILQEQALDIPFIIVSGTIGDEVAVTAMRQGAADYLLKDRMARLGPAVGQALERRRLRDAKRHADEALRESDRRYGALAAVSPVGIIHMDAGGACVEVNERWCKLSGMSARFALGEGWIGALHPEDRDAVLARWRGAVRDKLSFAAEYRFARPDRSATWVVHQAVADVGTDGVLRGYIGAITDVTAQKCSEEALRQSEERYRHTSAELAVKNAKLAELYETAHRFVDNVSHEFRTPLTVIKGYAEAVADGLAGPASPQQKEMLDICVDRTRELAQMVDDLLDTSKLRAGTLRVDRRRVRVQEILEQVRPVLERVAAANKVALAQDVPDELPEVFADAEKAARVVINLAVNAVKFSPEGSRVTLWVKTTADGGAEVGVSDQGPGIAADQLNAIFERFKQVGDPQRSSTKGFGLGLNIAKELVALNLGSMKVESQVGKGSSFSFTLVADEPQRVLERYIAYLEASGTQGREIALLRVVRQAATDAPWDLRAALAAVVKPAELILDASDGRGLFILGCTDDAAQWMRRLRSAAAEVCPGGRDQRGPQKIRITRVGSWAYPAGCAEAALRAVDELRGGHARAA